MSKRKAWEEFSKRQHKRGERKPYDKAQAERNLFARILHYSGYDMIDQLRQRMRTQAEPPSKTDWQMLDRLDAGPGTRGKPLEAKTGPISEGAERLRQLRQQWLRDHPDHKELPKGIRQELRDQAVAEMKTRYSDTEFNVEDIATIDRRAYDLDRK